MPQGLSIPAPSCLDWLSLPGHGVKSCLQTPLFHNAAPTVHSPPPRAPRPPRGPSLEPLCGGGLPEAFGKRSCLNSQDC